MGPLAGVKIIELVGIGPGPFAGMMLADMGAEVVAVDRPGGVGEMARPADISRRGKHFVEIDLKSSDGREAFLTHCDGADALIEGFRPGVMEKLGLGPEDVLARHPRLVFGRMTGWGQEGPLAQAAGHDLNYIALAGALHSMGAPDSPPTPPLNLIGDYGGGGMLLAFGVVCAILEARQSGAGQVVDAAMVDGASIMMSLFHSLHATGDWSEQRGANFLDGGAHFYGAYRTKDDNFVSFAAIELKFMKVFVEKAGLGDDWLERHWLREEWHERRRALEEVFASRTLDEWRILLEGTDACFAPALPFWRAHEHPHHQARNAFIEVDGVRQPAPAPRFSRTKPNINVPQKPTDPKKR